MRKYAIKQLICVTNIAIDCGFQLHIQKECPAVEMPCPNNCDPNRVMKRKEVPIISSLIFNVLI